MSEWTSRTAARAWGGARVGALLALVGLSVAGCRPHARPPKLAFVPRHPIEATYHLDTRNVPDDPVCSRIGDLARECAPGSELPVCKTFDKQGSLCVDGLHEAFALGVDRVLATFMRRAPEDEADYLVSFGVAELRHVRTAGDSESRLWLRWDFDLREPYAPKPIVHLAMTTVDPDARKRREGVQGELQRLVDSTVEAIGVALNDTPALWDKPHPGHEP